MRLGVLRGPTRIAAFALAIGGPTMPSSLFAQGGAAASGTVAGVVTDRLTRLPLQDARIAIPGTTLGALTTRAVSIAFQTSRSDESSLVSIAWAMRPWRTRSR